MATEEFTLQELSQRDDGHEFLRLIRRSDFKPPAPESRYGDFVNVREWAEWTCPSKPEEEGVG